MTSSSFQRFVSSRRTARVVGCCGVFAAVHLAAAARVAAQPSPPASAAPSRVAPGGAGPLPASAVVASGAEPQQPGEVIVVEGHPGDAARARALGEAPFVTVIAAAQQRGRLRSIAEAAAATVGIAARMTGGVGSSAYLSVRGAASGHTGVLIDGVPLSRLTSVSVDLGRFQLDDLEAVEIYRGTVPVELGGAGVGGAINLVTRVGPGASGERMWLSAGVGSYGTRRAAARYGDRWAGLDVAAGAGYLHSDGGYLVYSDAGTPLNRTDDSWVRRDNSGSTQVDATVRARRTHEDGATSAGLRATWRRHGLPGLVAAPAMHASLATGLALLDVDDVRAIGAWDASHRAFALGEWQRFIDRHDEIGLARQDREYLTLGAGASSTWRRTFGRHRAQAGLDARLEQFRDRDRLMGTATLHGARRSVAVSLGDELALDAWLLSAVARLDLTHTDPAPSPSAGEVAVAPRTELAPSPRLSARVLASPDLAVKASAGMYVRQPTLVELFGDRGFIVGSPELRAERGPSLDLGLVWAPGAPRGPADEVAVELAGFYNRADDAIVFVNTGFVARPVNVGSAENLGLEASGRVRLWRAVSLLGAYTLSRSLQRDPERSFDGKDLPRHPRHAVLTRLEAEGRVWARALRARVDWTWTSQSFLDRANLQAVPSRRLASVGASAELGGGFALGLELRNVGDRRVEQLALDPPPSPELTSTPVAVADIAGLPLPGRTFYLSLEWSR